MLDEFIIMVIGMAMAFATFWGIGYAIQLGMGAV